MKKYSNVVVSNRLPIKVTKKGGRIAYMQSDGGLPTALASLDGEDRIWIGWPGIDSDQLTDKEKTDITKELTKHNCVPVFLSSKDIELFYEGYSNDTLWPLFHYFPSYMINRDDYWEAYRRVNTVYCDQLQQAAKADARVWVHDYHLMLLPAMVREIMPHSLVGYFHHTPFPSYEIFRLLPERKDILLGLLGADLIGFQIFDYGRHFLSSCLRLLDIPNEYGNLAIEGRTVKVDSFPISIDTDRFNEIRLREDTQSQYESLIDTYSDQRIIFSIDRLDYSKGIIERLNGYQQFLVDNPEYLGQVVLIMIVSPSRTGVAAYQDLQLKIEQLVSHINGEFGTAEWTPISYQSQTLSLEEIVPMFMAADTMLVTPLRDGMNLVAKEYVASKGDIPGVLILSEMTGAVEELPEALVINPNNISAIAEAIRESFSMSEREKLTRLNAMQKRINDHPVKLWGEDYLEELDAVGEQRVNESIRALKGEQLDTLTMRFKKAKNRLIVLNYDGTLQHFKKTPSAHDAAPSQELHELVARLSAKKHTRLSIVTGRGKDALETWFGDTRARLVAEHGAWTKQGKTWQARPVNMFESAREIVLPILKDYTSHTPGSRIEEKDYAIVWHYRNVNVDLASIRAFNLRQELNKAIADNNILVHSGNKIIEIKPESVNKGAAVERLLDEHTADFVLIAGDDYTDEDMFRAAPEGAYTVKVGPGDTAADFRIPNVAAMHRLLQALADS